VSVTADLVAAIRSHTAISNELVAAVRDLTESVKRGNSLTIESQRLTAELVEVLRDQRNILQDLLAAPGRELRLRHLEQATRPPVAQLPTPIAVRRRGSGRR
jgi:hypothetical protein